MKRQNQAQNPAPSLAAIVGLPIVALLAIVICLTGCEVGPNYHTPNTPMPGGYVAATQPASGPATRPVDLARWWQSLGDPRLDDLIEQAIVNNPDAQIALLRLQEAREQEAAIGGTAWPYVGVTAAAGRGSGNNSVKGRDSPIIDSGTNTSKFKEITEVAGFDSAWEIDLFGYYRRQIEAARYDCQAAAEARNAVLISLISDVARAYMDARALQLRLAIAEQNIRTEQQTTDLVQVRFQRGLTNELDVALAHRQLATVEAQVAPLAASLESAQHRLAVLEGAYPEDLADGDLSANAPPPKTLPLPPMQIETGLPLDLLRRRPDIRAQERALAAATARIGVDTANLFPRVALTGAVGIEGQGLGRSPQTTGFLWTIGPALYWPVLDFGTLDALIEVQNLRTREQLIQYKKTVLAAVQEVDDAIANFDAEREHLRHLDDALAASERSVDLATQRYNRGLTDFLNVLDAEREMYELEDEDAQAQETVVLQFIAVYKGLGGGWEMYQSIPPVHQPMPAIVAMVQRAAATQP
jgi:NodT family efflux transporter outer membrane factor (OMF) lipoprotein